MILSLSLATRFFQPLAAELRHAVEPARVELGALVLLEEVLARAAVALGEPHQAALVADQALVDVVELLDQRIDARLVQPQRLHRGDDLFLELLVLAFLRRRERVSLELERDVLVLQAAKPLVLACDGVEGLQHLGLELGLDRGVRYPILHIVVVEVTLAPVGCRFLPIGAFTGDFEWGRGSGGLRRLAGLARSRDAGDRDRLAVRAVRRCGWHRLGVGPGIGRFEIDDVAQEHLSFFEFITPDDDGLEGERAFAQACDHRLAAGLDALGDRDLALAREQLHRAHLAQIHAHGIVGALGRLLGLGLGWDLLLDLDQFGLLLVVLLARSPRRRRPPRSRPR